MFELTHPGPTGRGGRRYSALGIDKPGDPDDATYRKCAQCGFPCKTDRDARGNSENSPGLQQVTTTVNIVASLGGGTVDKIEMQVVAGCPFCGSLNYEGLNRMRTNRASNQRKRR